MYTDYSAINDMYDTPRFYHTMYYIQNKENKICSMKVNNFNSKLIFKYFIFYNIF